MCVAYSFADSTILRRYCKKRKVLLAVHAAESVRTEPASSTARAQPGSRQNQGISQKNVIPDVLIIMHASDVSCTSLSSAPSDLILKSINHTAPGSQRTPLRPFATFRVLAVSHRTTSKINSLNSRHRQSPSAPYSHHLIQSTQE